MWGIRKRGLRGGTSGESIVGFAILAPILLTVTLGIMEFSLTIFDYHRASEATRRGARLATISQPVADVGAFAAGTVITCSSSGDAISCSGLDAALPGVFDTIVAQMQAVLPAIMPENIEIEYSDSGLGDAATPGGIIPIVTVRLVGLTQSFYFIGAIPGLPDGFTFPPFTTNQMGAGLGPTGA